MKARTQPQENVYFNNKIKQRATKTTPKGENRQAGRELLHSQHNTHTLTKDNDQHKTTDTRGLNRETNEGNEGDTGGATETTIR